MTRLMEAAQQLQQENAVPKSVKASSDLGISKAIASRWLSSSEFHRVKVDIGKLPLLAGEILASGEAPQHVVIIDLNKNKVNCSATYTPKITVVCGASLVKAAKSKGVNQIECWVGNKAAKALKVKLPKVEANLAMLSKLGFNPSPGGENGIFDLQPTNLMRNKSASFPDSTQFGPPGSELNNPGQFMSMLNIEEALRMYLHSLKEGIWKPVSSQWATVPPSLVDATNEAGLIGKEKGLAAGFAPLDFVYWQMKQLEAPVKHKYADGQRLSASKFAFVGEPDDPSTWLFRADSPVAIQASIGEIKSCKYLSKAAKVASLGELRKRSGL